MNNNVKTINFFDLVLMIVVTFILVYLIFLLTAKANLYIMDNFVFPLFFLLSIYGLGIYTGINFYKGKRNESAGVIGYFYFKNTKDEKINREDNRKDNRKDNKKEEYKILNYNHDNKKEEIKKIENK